MTTNIAIKVLVRLATENGVAFLIQFASLCVARPTLSVLDRLTACLSVRLSVRTLSRPVMI
jgi:hypothetical protein